MRPAPRTRAPARARLRRGPLPAWALALAALAAPAAPASPAAPISPAGPAQEPGAGDERPADPATADPAQGGALDSGAPDAGAGGRDPGASRASPGRPDGTASRTDYVLRARVDVPGHRLRGTATLRWHNRSADAVDDLWFHLYHNAFANDRSTHVVESGGSLRGLNDERDDWGWQRMTALAAGGADVLGTLRYRHPDDDNDEDRTVFSVELPEPVQPGAVLEIELAWEAKIPRVRRRTGHRDDFLFLAHWFPKLGVYESGRGWNCHQFHRNTEFFADFGAYDVTLDLPDAYAGKVGASGVAVPADAQPEPGRVLERFVAPSPADQERLDRTGKPPLVHGFAWTADPDFVEHRETFLYDLWRGRYPAEVERVRAALGAEREVRLREVDIRVLIQPERAGQAERHAEATAATLFFYGLWFGEYPYEQLTVVDPAWGGGAAGGMEYPTLFTGGTRLFTFPGMHSPEGVVVHEAGHQFWYGLVGNNEFEAAWLDEGLNSYADSEVLFRHYGEDHRTTEYAGLYLDGVAVARGPGGGALADALAMRRWPVPYTDIELRPLPGSDLVEWWREQPLLGYSRRTGDPRWMDRSRYLSDPATDPIDTRAWEYADRRSYRTNSYPRPAVALRTLAGVVGPDAFLRGMRHFSETWRYDHPYPDDFYAAFQEGAGVDVQWYFDEVFRGTGTVDWGVEVSQRRERAPRGWFQASPGEPFVRREGEGDEDEDAEGASEAERDAEPAAGEAADAAGAREGRPWDVDVLVRRRGTLRLPVALELAWDDGERERLVWTREAQAERTWWRPLEGRAPGPRKLVSAVLDPERVIYLDTDMSDNQWYAEEDELAPLRWAERAFTQYAHLLFGYGGVGG